MQRLGQQRLAAARILGVDDEHRSGEEDVAHRQRHRQRQGVAIPRPATTSTLPCSAPPLGVGELTDQIVEHIERLDDLGLGRSLARVMSKSLAMNVAVCGS